MGLSRLDNFLKSVRGNILYVNPNDLDATDSIENQGNSLTRPFKTIQRALIESSRFSYQKGLNNDRFGKTTILLYPGEHTVDNRPGYIPFGANQYYERNGSVSNDLPPYDLTTNFDLDSPNNELFKLNSVFGGVIIPRGTSLVGLDLRKTKIRPKYVPSPTNDNIERSSLFRVTGGCYFWQFSMFDADPNGKCYVDYTTNEFVPNFSHHKLTCFEYADGVNNVSINDDFLTYDAGRTDLQMYYEKVGLVYGQSSGRAISPDYPSSGIDIQPKIDEYRIVGSTGKSVGISSIKAGDGVTATTTITVTTTSAVDGLQVDTPFRIEGISATGYDGQFVVSDKPSDTIAKYQVQNTPLIALPPVAGATLTLSSDTVTSASPYIFNVSLRSVFGMCGMFADGSKATGFKSMVVAQFTGIGLQKDNDAFVLYNNDTPQTGTYDDSTVISNLHTNSNAVYKPSYKNFHVKCSNDAVLQIVSVFAIGYAEHFVAESGGDQSITNSNSNFGAKALIAQGYKKDAFSQDNTGYITHIIPPKEIPLTESAVEFEAIDVLKTLPSGYSAIGVGSTANLYLYGKNNEEAPPENVIEGYRFGARINDSLKILVSSAGTVTEYSSRIVMPGSEDSSEKVFTVNQSVTGINSIGNRSDGGNSNTITFDSVHTLINGESIRVISDNGHLPDGLDPNTVYFAITDSNTNATGVTTNTNIQVAKTFNDSVDGEPIAINNKGGLLKVVSRVSDKNSGDIGHPIQWDSDQTQWYVKVAAASTENAIFDIITGIGSTGLGDATSRSYIKRRTDNRNNLDTLYRARYVLPKDGGVARPPSDGFIIQESNTSIGSTNTEIETYFGSGSLANDTQQRNFSFIADATWDGSTVSVATELPHDLSIGSEVEIVNVTSTENTSGAAKAGFNRTYTVTGISSSKEFSVGLTTDPGTFTNNTATRNTSLPHYKRKRYDNTYYVYNSEESQKFVSGEQDGVYYLTLLNASNKPTVSPFVEESFSQPIKELYPQTDRDTPNADPDETRCFVESDLIGDVVVNDVKNSITKETINKYNRDQVIGVGITEITSVAGTAHTITTNIDHGLNRVTKLTITDGGAGYGSGAAGDLYNAKLVSIGSSVTGSNATAKLTVDSSGTITAVKVMDGGSAYGIGNTLAVAVGVGTTTGFSQAVLTVDKIYDNVGDSIRITGVGSESYSGYNTLYRITDVPIGAGNSVTVATSSTITGFTTATGIGATNATDSYLYLTGEAIRIDTLTFNENAGIATVTTVNPHGLRVDHRVSFTGFTTTSTLYNGNWVVTDNINLNSFSVNIGVGTTSPTAYGTAFALREGYAANDGVITEGAESLNGRMIPTYAGITTTLSATVATETTGSISITNLANLDVNIGDYLVIDDEIVRVKTTVASGAAAVTAFRGVLGSKAGIHTVGSVVRKVSMKPVELRRHSIIRASGHTFEYVGFGPGNYSTALPDRQNRSLSFEEEILSQSLRKDAGAVFYTGMNDKGVSYNGNKRLSSATGKEEIFNTPVATVTGEDIGELSGLNVADSTEINVSRSIKVEGGADSKVASEFNGPIIVNNKLTSNSSKGIEAQAFYVQGDQTVSRKHTLSATIPSLAGNPGDINYLSDPADGGYVGWIYTSNNEWRKFGTISLASDSEIAVFDQVGIATTTPGINKFQVGGGTSLVAIDSDGIGIGTTANSYGLYANKDVRFDKKFYGSDGNAGSAGDVLKSTGAGVTWATLGSIAQWSRTSGDDGIYNTDLDLVGIGTSSPRYVAEIGSVGASGTTFHVNGDSRFVGLVTAADVTVGGALTAVGTYKISNTTSGTIHATSIGVATDSPLQSVQVGSAGTNVVVVTSGGKVGVGTTNPTIDGLDVQAHTRLQSYSEQVTALTISSNNVEIDLSKSQTFTLSLSDSVTDFTLVNIPSESTSFTLKITQDSTGSRNVGIDTFKIGAGTTFPVFWPSGVVPIVTTTASKTDIYSFKIFDGSNISTVGMYGIVGGQNFT